MMFFSELPEGQCLGFLLYPSSSPSKRSATATATSSAWWGVWRTWAGRSGGSAAHRRSPFPFFVDRGHCIGMRDISSTLLSIFIQKIQRRLNPRRRSSSSSSPLSSTGEGMNRGEGGEGTRGRRRGCLAAILGRPPGVVTVELVFGWWWWWWLWPGRCRCLPQAVD